MSDLNRALACFFLLMSFVGLPRPASAQVKAPVPSAEARQSAREKAREIYGDRFKEAKTAGQKSALATEIVEAAPKTPNGSADQFVLLVIAGDIAAAAGDAGVAVRAMEGLRQRFDVQAARLKTDAIIEAAEHASLSNQHKGVADAAGDLIPELTAEDDYETAVMLCKTGQAAAQKAREYALAKEFAAQLPELEQQEKASRGYRDAMKVLSKAPADPAANLAAGRYICFVRGDWERGISMLAMGSDEQLKALAVRDLQGPVSAEEQANLGDGWLALAKSRVNEERDTLIRRAVFWYRKALTDATGLDRLRIEKQLKEIPKTGGDEADNDVPDLLSGRGNGKNELVISGGGNAASERAVALALQWLAEHQMPDGGWTFNHALCPKCKGQCRNPGSDNEARAAATGLALLPFLGAGQTHKTGKYKATVKSGLYFLISRIQVSPKGGSLCEKGRGQMYAHGICSIALCEAYALTHDNGLHGPAQQAINFICYAQDPIGGGWRYQPRQKGDTSVTSWQLSALMAGRAASLRMPASTLTKASGFLDNMQSNSGANYGYVDPGAGQATTAIGLLGRMYLGWKKDNPALQRGVDWLAKQGPSKSNSYYNFYATQVMHHWEGETWEKWNSVMRDFLVKSQTADGHEQGSWFLKGDHGADIGGRIYCTALAATILEVYYRSVPIYRAASTGASVTN